MTNENNDCKQIDYNNFDRSKLARRDSYGSYSELHQLVFDVKSNDVIKIPDENKYCSVICGDGRCEGKCPSCNNHIEIGDSEFYIYWGYVWDLNGQEGIIPCQHCNVLLDWSEDWDD